MTVNDTDKFLVNRQDDQGVWHSYNLEAQNLMAQLEDNDLMLVNRQDDQGVWHSYKATGLEIKDSLGGPSANIDKPVILTPSDGATDANVETLVLTGSVPSGLGINTWGNATWEVDTNVAFGSAMIAIKAITPGAQQTLEPSERGAIILEPETQYYARLKYNSTDPAGVSAYSAVVTFQVIPDDTDADVSNSAAPGTPYAITQTDLGQLVPLAGGELAIAASMTGLSMRAVGLSRKIYKSHNNPLYFNWSDSGSDYLESETGFQHINDTHYLVLTDGKTKQVTKNYSDGSVVQEHTFSSPLIFFKTQNSHGIAITDDGAVWIGTIY